MSQMLLENTPVSAGEDDIRQYLHEIRQYPRLTPEQERELAMECAKGDPEAIKTMVNSNLRLVVSVAREYAGRGVPLMDLIQEGSIGLIVAAKKFDYAMDFLEKYPRFKCMVNVESQINGDIKIMVNSIKEAFLGDFDYF